jgi:hypothetical protein
VPTAIQQALLERGRQFRASQHHLRNGQVAMDALAVVIDRFEGRRERFE